MKIPCLGETDESGRTLLYLPVADVRQENPPRHGRVELLRDQAFDDFRTDVMERCAHLLTANKVFNHSTAAPMRDDDEFRMVCILGDRVRWTSEVSDGCDNDHPHFVLLDATTTDPNEPRRYALEFYSDDGQYKVDDAGNVVGVGMYLSPGHLIGLSNQLRYCDRTR